MSAWSWPLSPRPIGVMSPLLALAAGCRTRTLSTSNPCAATDSIPSRVPTSPNLSAAARGVVQPAPAVVEEASEAHQRDLRRVGLVVEHRLAREQPADGHAVQHAHEAIVAPGLDRVHPAERVEA